MLACGHGNGLNFPHAVVIEIHPKSYNHRIKWDWTEHSKQL